MLDFRKTVTTTTTSTTSCFGSEKTSCSPPAAPRITLGKFWSTTLLSSRHASRLQALQDFFTDERLELIVIPIISVVSDISLRALDWFVINYAKKHKIALGSTDNPTTIVNVYSTYRCWLKFWHRNLFDAFRRGTRIYFLFKDQVYSTTVAQLNFLYWAETSGILRYAQENIKAIEQDMNIRIAECRKEKERIQKAGGKRKRSELSKATFTEVAIYSVPSTFIF